jgi:cytochrome c2
MNRVAVLALLLGIACNRGETAQPQEPAATGDAQRGRQLITQYGCAVCHTIPGIETARGRLGPSLEGVASRPSISFGTVQNTPANLAQFIQNPASLNPQSSMPPLALEGNDAQDIAAFLMTLR